jgi:hypothetical protein
MRRILLLVLTLAAHSAPAAVPSGCQEDYETCKEDCSIEFGGSRRTLSELTRCIAKCQETLDTCAARHSSLKTPAGRARADSQNDPYAGSDSEPKSQRGGGKAAASVEKAPTQAAEAPSTQAAKPAAAPASPAATRQGVYRASESETAEAAPAPKPAPAPAPEPEEGLVPMDDVPPPAPKAAARSRSKKEPAKPAPVVEASEDEKDPLLDEEPPPPPPEKKVSPVVSPARSAPPPEPKKKDISEWDPNGD